MNRIPCFILLCATAFSLSAQHRIIYVDSAATGALTGRSWPDAYVDLQDALTEAAHGDEIRLAQGTYFPARDGDRLRSYVLKSGVAVKGGYRGGTVQPDDRDFEQYRSILSGDIGVRGDPFDNSTNLILAENCDTSTLLEGLELRFAGSLELRNDSILQDCVNDHFSLSKPCAGSAINIWNTDSTKLAGLKLRRVMVLGNQVVGRGTVVVNGTLGPLAIIAEECTFSNSSYNGEPSLVIEGKVPIVRFLRCNLSYNSSRSYGVYGSALYAYISEDNFKENIFCLDSCLFTFNGGLESGPPVYILSSNTNLDIGIEGCIFSLNSVAGPFNETTQGGALLLWALCKSAIINRCNFIGNTGGWGGALAFGVKPSNGPAIISNCTFEGNYSFGNGGAIYFIGGSSVKLVNCNFINNSTAGTGSCFYGYGFLPSEVIVENCIFHKNSSSRNTFAASQLNPLNLKIDHSLLPDTAKEKLYEFFGTEKPVFHIGPRNLYGLDPLWGQNFRPLHCSPLIDAGDAAVWDTLAAQGVSLLDYAGQPRIKGLAPDIGLLEGEGFGMQLRGGYQGCAGQGSGTLQLRLSGAYPYTYPWQENDSIAIITDLPPGRHRIQVTDALGCTREDSVDIVLPLPLSYSVQVVQPEPNQKGSASISGITGGVPPYQYNWNTGDTTSAVSDLGPGDYRVNISDSGGCVEELQVFLRLSGINEGDLTQQGFQLYPQPTLSGSTAQLSAAWQEPLELQLWDAAGHLVKSWPAFAFVPQADIQAPALPGLYFLSVKGRVSGKLGVLRWMVQ